MSQLSTLLDLIKCREGIVNLPPIAETMTEMFVRTDTPNSKARISEGIFFDLSRHTCFVIERLPYHAFIRWNHEQTIRLVWIDSWGPKTDFWGTRLTKVETDELVLLRGIKGIQISGDFTFTDTGMGPFAIRSLLPGERFMDIQNRNGVVMLPEADNIVEVILSPDTIRASRQRWNGAMRVYVPSVETAKRIARTRPALLSKGSPLNV